jgi:hypothetical protein
MDFNFYEEATQPLAMTLIDLDKASMDDISKRIDCINSVSDKMTAADAAAVEPRRKFDRLYEQHCALESLAETLVWAECFKRLAAIHPGYEIRRAVYSPEDELVRKPGKVVYVDDSGVVIAVQEQ